MPTHVVLHKLPNDDDTITIGEQYRITFQRKYPYFLARLLGRPVITLVIHRIPEYQAKFAKEMSEIAKKSKVLEQFNQP